MRVFLNPVGLYSTAMVRMARALRVMMPEHCREAQNERSADLIVLYAIGPDTIERCHALRAENKRYTIVQCCLETAGYRGREDAWADAWYGAELVWSYYDLRETARREGFNFYHAPLGLDACFVGAVERDSGYPRDLVLTTGYVHGDGAEALEEAWWAAADAGLRPFHVGPASVAGAAAKRPPGFESREGIKDFELVELMLRSRYVVALRHVEGFELPAAEGLACGARAVLFDQPALRYWYGDMAEYVPETAGEPLRAALRSVLCGDGRVPLAGGERREAARSFNWDTIADGFWSRVDAAHSLQVVGGAR